MSFAVGYVPEVSLLATLKTMSLQDASALGIDVVSIEIGHRTCPNNLHLKLLKSLSEWSDHWGTLVDNIDSNSSYAYGSTSTNGRVLKGREYSTTDYYADFSVTIVKDEGYMQSFHFKKLSPAEQILLRAKRSYKPSHAISMLQIAYGLLENYDGVVADILGFIPIPRLPDFAAPM